MEVRALTPNTFIAWKCLNENDAWSGTEISFELSEQSDFTCLDFKHSGYRQQDGLYATCNYHWARHLSMLKELCETGKPQLDQEKEEKEVAAVHGKKA